MNLNFKKLTIYFFILIFGMSLIVYSMLDFMTLKNSQEISDKEIIRRAKDLGMVEVKKQLENKKNE
ncbi:MAG: hypothetical protein ACQEQE_07885 [Bacillota bacterium]